MKLSFSLQSKSSASRPRPSQSHAAAAAAPGGDSQREYFTEFSEQPTEQRREYVTQFDASKTLTDSNPKFVIPPKENEWRPYKKMKNLGLPSISADGSRDLQFEVESATANDSAGGNMAYGLNLRQSSKDDSVTKDGITESGSVPLPVETVLLQSLKEDLKRLPEDRGVADFEDVPVEGFGAALLAGYGWREGKGIGKNAKEDVKVKQYERRADRGGIGFISEALPTEKMPNGGKSENSENRNRLYGKSEGGDRLSVGKGVRVIDGKYMGSEGEIVKRLSSGWIALKMKKSQEEVEVRTFDIVDLGSKEEELFFQRLKELKIRESKVSKRDSKESRHKRSRDSEKRGVRESRDNGDTHKRDDGGRVKSKERGVSWLRSHIRVRIVSKDLEGGRFYLKKGEVVDVVGPYMCDISMDENRELIQGVDQDLLESALPKRGGSVLVLYGKHKDVLGTLVERDLDREVGVVRDNDSHELLNVKLEQIAEYIGDPSYFGY